MSQNRRIMVRSVNKRQPKVPQKQKKRSVVPPVHQRESRTAKFHMFTFKIGNGRRKLTFHNGVYNYGTDKCPYGFNNSRRCPSGSKCRFAHSALEILFHPLVYKTRFCSKREACGQGKDCAWAHSNEELRNRAMILGKNWRFCDPIGRYDKPMRKTAGSRTRVQLVSRSSRNDVGLSAMSVASAKVSVAEQVPSRTVSPNSQGTMDMSVTTVGEETKCVEEMEVGDDCVKEMECRDGAVANDMEKPSGSPSRALVLQPVSPRESCDERKMSEFEWWFTKVFDCEDQGLPYRAYLDRFIASQFDDLSFLWSLHTNAHEEFMGVLVNEIGMDSASVRGFERWMCDYKSPVDVEGWMIRVVKLPQYENIFSHYESVDVLRNTGIDADDLAEMGVSSLGHQAKILYHLRKLTMEM